MILGSILVIIGIVFLLQNLGYIFGNTWSIIWPTILIAIGVEIAQRERRFRFLFAPLEKFWKKKTKEFSKRFREVTAKRKRNLEGEKKINKGRVISIKL